MPREFKRTIFKCGPECPYYAFYDADKDPHPNVGFTFSKELCQASIKEKIIQRPFKKQPYHTDGYQMDELRKILDKEWSNKDGFPNWCPLKKGK